MAQDRIDSFYDLEELKRNREAALQIVREGTKAIIEEQEKIKGSPTSPNSANPSSGSGGKNIKDLTASLKEYIAQNERLIVAQAKLAQSTSDDAKALAAYKVELASVTKQQKEEAQLVSAATGAYEKLNIQHKQAVKAYQDAAAAGKLSAQQLVAMKDSANALGKQLTTIDLAVNKYGRQVGNYSSAWNGLGMSIQQVAREMPNFAQSAQLGFLAISNNLPILADEIQRAKENIAALKAEGKDAPSLFSQIAASVFSWQTLLTIGITLLVKYGEQITDWAMSVSDAEKVIQNYNKSLSDAIKSESDGISKLVAAKQAINDNSVSRETQLRLLNEARAAYPEYLSALDIEKNSTQEINAALEQQMEIRIGIAKTKAAEATLADATNEQIKAFQELNKQATLWDRFLAAIQFKGRDLTEYNEGLTKSNLELAASLSEQFKSGQLTSDQYVVQLKRLGELNEAQKKEATAVDLVKYATDDLSLSYSKQIKELEGQIKSKQKNIALYPSLKGVLTSEINDIQKVIASLRGEIIERQKLLDIKSARVATFGITELEREKIAAENLARTFKEGTKQRLDAEIAARKVQLKIDLQGLKDKENVSVSYLAADKNYNERYATLRAEAISKSNDEIAKLQDGYNKKAAKAAKEALPKKDKFTDEKEAIAAQKAIAENEEMTFKQRYDAAVKFSELSQDLLKKENRFTTDNLIVMATETDKLLKKINDDKEKLRLEDLRKQEEHSKELARVILEQLNNVQENENAAREKELSLLSDDLANRKISLQQYNNQKLTINDKYDGIILQNQKDALRAYLEELKNSGELQGDEVARIEEKITDITNAQSANRIDKVEDDAKKRKELKDREFEYEKQIAQELQNFIFQMLDARAEKEISVLEKTKERLSEEYDLKTSAVDKAAISEEERSARKAVLVAEEAEQQKRLDDEIRKIKIKQAKYDKAQALATIAINTAIAASSPTNLALGGTLTPLIIGLGAAQAAIVLATPLPEYAKGKKASDSYEGLAIAGEKGTEMKIDKDGKLELLTRPTLIHTKRGDTILSNEQLRKGELGKHIKTDVAKSNYDELIRAYSYNTDKLVKAVKNSGNNVIIDNSNYNLNIQKARA